MSNYFDHLLLLWSPISDTAELLLWSPYVIGQTIIFSSCGFYLVSSFFPRLISAFRDWMSTILADYFGTWCGPSVNLECRSETCCSRLAGNAGPKKSPSGHHRTTLSGCIFATKTRIVKQQYLLHVSSYLWPTNGRDRFNSLGTLANFNWFRVFAALVHGI